MLKHHLANVRLVVLVALISVLLAGSWRTLFFVLILLLGLISLTPSLRRTFWHKLWGLKILFISISLFSLWALIDQPSSAIAAILIPRILIIVAMLAATHYCLAGLTANEMAAGFLSVIGSRLGRVAWVQRFILRFSLLMAQLQGSGKISLSVDAMVEKLIALEQVEYEKSVIVTILPPLNVKHGLLFVGILVLSAAIEKIVPSLGVFT